ncbi:hypothetical protein KSF_058880 [Reticulibacter mediterranei]|uniref:Uncharacterized protein n=1 Tax=Reticulibacter mediterranei TaxID=2778369 RepID=A0A8J3INZ3_9CHLR|nr:hypothetical protein [Reticulibacter mediterranei]GHO95840.1 hypothetical protein KSF_058880 [Reticulibacter mediterranei]
MLERADIDMKNRVRTTLEQVYHQRSEDFISIPQQMEGIQNQLVENAKKRMRTSVDDPMYDLLEEEKRDLMERQGCLKPRKKSLVWWTARKTSIDYTAYWAILKQYGLPLT